MKCVIFCGGSGMRMGHLTKDLPKPLIEVDGQTILERIMDHYASYGIKDFILCVGYMGEVIKKHFVTHTSKYNLSIVDTGESTPKSQRLMKVKNLLINEENFFVSYGDDLADVNIEKLLEFHKKESKIATLTTVRLRSDYGLIELDEYEPNVISKFKEKPFLNEWINAGYFVFNKDIFNYLEEGELEKEVFNKLVSKKQIAAYRHAGFWKSINTPKDVSEINKILNKDFTID